MELRLPRKLWLLSESYHAVVYFAPENADAYTRAGLKGGWMAYFASRSAAFGPVRPEVVTATFYNFHPAMVARAIPDAWRFSSPERVLAARREAVDAALRRLLGGDGLEDKARAATEIARAALAEADPGGRALFAAHLALPWPDEPLPALWHACTLLREHRGDAHVAALVAEGLDGREAHITLAATGAAPAEILRGYRGWSEEEWSAAEQRLRERGLLDDDGELTETGARVRARVEAATDAASAAPWRAVGESKAQRFVSLMRTPVRLIVERGGLAFPNPIGLARDEIEEVLRAA